MHDVLLAAVLRLAGGSVVLTDEQLGAAQAPSFAVTRDGDRVTVHLVGAPEPAHLVERQRLAADDLRRAQSRVAEVLREAGEADRRATEALRARRLNEEASAAETDERLRAVEERTGITVTGSRQGTRRR